MADIYLRDLNDERRAEVEREIRSKRPDLAKVMDHNNTPEAEYEVDIIVGTFVKVSDYEANTL